MKIATVILAAGESRRMGSLKQMLMWGNDTVLGQTITVFQRAETGPVFVVVGCEGQKIREHLGERRVIWVNNPAYRQGMSSSIKAGIEVLPRETEAVLLALGDLPLLKSETVREMTASFCRDRHPIIVPAFRGRTGHPVLMAREFFPELLNLEGDVGAKKIVRNNRERVYYLTVKDPGICLDIDEPQTYTRLRPTKEDISNAGLD